MISTIDLTFSGKYSLELALTTLQKAGWHFGDNAIKYNILGYDNDADVEENIVPLSELSFITKLFDEALKRGEKVSIQLLWPEIIQGYCTFYSELDCSITFFARPPQLEGCGRFTDFSWLISRIVCPLQIAGCDVLTLKCTDDFD